jgi:steroid delta-isomerase-like uncharacterized protein
MNHIATENKALIQQLYIDLFRDWRLERIDEIFSPGFRSTEMPSSLPDGPAGVRRFYETLRLAFPDLTYVVEDLVAEGQKVVVRWRWQGTHLGAFRGIPATGRKVDLTGIAIYRVVDGQVVQRWVEGNVLGLLRTLGAEVVVPQPTIPE